jgi:hypothetical protein
VSVEEPPVQIELGEALTGVIVGVVFTVTVAVGVTVHVPVMAVKV